MDLSRGMLEGILGCLPRAAFVCDEECRVVAQNQCAAQRVALVLGNTLLPLQPRVQAALLSEGVECWTTQLSRPSGRQFEAELAAQRITVDGRGMLLVLMNELHAAARFEDSPQSHGMRLRQAVHLAQIGTFEHDHRRKTIDFSPEQRAIYGWGLEVEPTLERILAAAHPRDMGRFAAAIARAHDPRGDGICDIEGRVLRPTGEVRWIHTRSQTWFGSAGGRVVPVRTVGASLDITENRAALERQRRLTSILDATPDLVGVVELDGDLLYVNRAACEVFGLGARPVLEDVIEQVGQDLRQYLAEVVVPSALRDGSWRGEVVSSTVCGPDQPYWLIVLTHRDEERVFISAIAHDLSILRRLQEEARQSQKMEAIGRLVGGVAHDFNNLLSVILGYIELSRAELPEGSPVADLLVESRLAAERAAGLTRQMLAFSRKQTLQPRVISLAEVLREMEPMVRRLVGEHIALCMNVGPEPLHIRADKNQIEQVVLNLVVNARDAMPDGGALGVEVRTVSLATDSASGQGGAPPRQYVILVVSDNGVGMDAATSARVFEPFFSMKGPGRGTGLGLATVLDIVKQSGGNIRVQSEPARGTTFEIYFPRSEEEPSVSIPPSAAPGPVMRRATILVVEDEPQLRSMLSTALRGEGHVVMDAQDPLRAIELASTYTGSIDILLTDVVMPHLNGKQLAEALASSRPEMRVVYMSGYTENAVVHQGALDPSICYLAKPVGLNALRGVICRALQERDDAVGAPAPLRSSSRERAGTAGCPHPDSAE